MTCNWDQSRRSTATVTRDDDPVEIIDSYLQHTYYKYEDRPGDRRVESRNGEDGRQCRDIITTERWKQQWGHFCIRTFNLRSTRSGWYYVGWTLAAIGAIVVVVVSGGTALGLFAAGGALVTTAGSLTATGAGILALGGFAFGAGVGLIRGVPDGYERIAPAKRQYTADAPTADWQKEGESTTTSQWRPC